VRQAVAEGESLGYSVSSVESGPIPAIVVGSAGEQETTLERVTVVITKAGLPELVATWVLVDDEWVFAPGIELP
jgi:hypothetical protein